MPEALVIVVGEDDVKDDLATFQKNWQSAVPGVEFAGTTLDDGPGSIEDFIGRLASIAASRALPLSRVILLGRGKTGRAALDLVMAGCAPVAGILAIDIALWPLPRRCPLSSVIVRLLQHGDADDPNFRRFFELIEQIRRKSLDIHYALLPQKNEATAEATCRAGLGYLAELVANASRLPPPETTP